VQTAESNFSSVEHFLYSRHERNANSMPQLHEIEAEILDLAQHFVARGMPPGIPAGGERDHGGNDE
jgi:hypothetical protein